MFESFTGLSEQGIPDWMLERAYGIVVVPKVFEIAVVARRARRQGRHGRAQPRRQLEQSGVPHVVRREFGFQWGMQMTDVVLVLMSRKSVEGISGGKFTLGVDASVAAGPVGRTASANTDPMLKAQVLSYSRSEGVFLGVSIEGTVISVDDDADATAYGVSDILASQILEGKLGTPPPAALEFTAALTRATERAAAAAAGATPATARRGAAPRRPPPAAEPKSGSPAQTYPMEDPQPGAPPPP